MSLPELWWHRFAAACPHGIFMCMTAGESPEHPEAMVARVGLVAGELETIGCGTEGCTVKLTYVRSWNHEPSEAEERAVTPFEHQ